MKKIMAILASAIMLISVCTAFSMTAFADESCDHNWCEDYEKSDISTMSCQIPSEYYYYCSICGDTKGPEYVYDGPCNYVRKVDPATPEKDGRWTDVCSDCGSVDESKIIYRPVYFDLSKSTYVYDGKAKKPTVDVRNKDDEYIISYKVTYKNNVKVGKAAAIVTFTGNKYYAGKKTVYFKIIPKGTSLSKLTKGKKAFTVKWKKASGITGYQIQYSTSKTFKSSVSKAFKAKPTTTAKTVKNLKSGKRYYVRIRTYKTVGGKNYISKWSKAASVVTL